MEIAFLEQKEKRKNKRKKVILGRKKKNPDFSIYANVSISAKCEQNKTVPLVGPHWML